jgi:hypothetical protein
MHISVLSEIEETIKWLEAPKQPHPREAQLTAAEKQELAERQQQNVPPGATSSDKLPSQNLYEAEAVPDLSASVTRQHWAAPYDDDYLVVTLANGAFNALDVLALSEKENLSFDDLKAAANNEDPQVEMIQPLTLEGKPWLTSISAAQVKAAGVLYLHCFYVAKARPGEGVLVRKTASRKLLDANADIAEIPNPHNVAGVAQVAHPSISPRRMPLVNRSHPKLAAQASVGAGAPAYTRLYLTLTGTTVVGGVGCYPWRAFVSINVELNPTQTPDKYDYIALAEHEPQDGTDYIASCYISDLDQGSYATSTRCDKAINSNLTVADLDSLESFWVFYGGWDYVNSKWIVKGSVSPYKNQKRWMTDSIADIGQKRLHEILIPGAHDCGTYDPIAKSTDAAHNAQTQNLDFGGQLALGTRYFDCRIQKWNRTQPFWFYHGGAQTWTNIDDLLSALKSFFAISEDIVILDFCRFGSFSSAADHQQLFDLFEGDPFFANLMMKPPEAQQLTVNELRALGRRLFILWENNSFWTDSAVGESINIDAEWPDTGSLATMETKLDAQVAAHAGTNKLWALQAVLTPNYPNGIVAWANDVSVFLHHKVVNDWSGNSNVIFCDFTAGADLVHSAKVCNKIRRGNQGKLFWYEHKDWQIGGVLPAQAGVEIGFAGWFGFESAIASSDGYIYAIDYHGNLLRYHDIHWHGPAAPMTNPPDTISSSGDWATHRLVFASHDISGGRVIYAITGGYQAAGTGKLWRFEDNGGPTLGQGVEIDGGWERFKFALASGNGTIYAVDGAGGLFRCQQSGNNGPTAGMQIGENWQGFRTAFATSEGVLYAIDWTGQMYWYRDLGGNQIPNPVPLGGDWGGFSMISATSDGVFYMIRE